VTESLDEGTQLVLRAAVERGNSAQPTPVGARADLERLVPFTLPPLAWVESWDEVVHGPAGDLHVRVHRPPGSDPSMAILHVHGGGWVTGSVEIVDTTCQHLASASGLTVASVGYRLAPESPFPAALDDVDAALDWLRGTAARPRIALLGESAGGAIAGGVALRRRDRGQPLPELQVLVYPALDPSMSTETHGRYGTGYGLDSELMGWYWQQYLGGASEVSCYAAPALAASLAGLPSSVILTAGFDPLRDEALDFAERLQTDGTPTTVLHYPNAIHGFVFCGGAIARGRQAVRELGAVVAAALAP
jgi:acetyl esterase